MSEKHRGPTKLGDALAEMLAGSALGARIARAEVLGHWEGAVGPQIAAVATARAIAENGTLTVSVKTHGWMHELALMERSLIAKVNKRAEQEIVRKIRWELQR